MAESQSFVRSRAGWVGSIILTGALGLPGVSGAQPAGSDPNPGAITFAGGLDVPSVYVFRGFVQERDPKLTLSPYGDLGFALKSSEGGGTRVGVNVGVWNSLQTGSSGSAGFTEHLHYQENFYTTLSLGLGKRLTVATTYTAYTSPNFMFNTVKEVGVKVAHSSRIKPYGLVGFDIGKDGADNGAKKGTYLELGVGPATPLFGKLTLTIPVKLGMSLKDYYELNGVDHRFGYLDAGVLLSRPISGASSSFGSWNLHGGVDLLVLGDTTRAMNAGGKNKVVGLVGIGVIY